VTRSYSMRTTRCWSVGALLTVVAVGSPCGAFAQAFPSSGEQVIRAMRQRYQDSWYRTLSFTERMERKVGDSTVKETWDEQLRIPGHLRIDVEHANPPRTIICNGDSIFLVHGDTVTRRADRNLLLIMGFDVYLQAPERTLFELNDMHFPMTPVHGDSWEGRPVYVIGAAKGDLHSPQLWIDQDRLLFLRALKPDPADSTKTLEYRFDNYKLEPEGWLSETVLELRDGKQFFREDYGNVRMNDRLDRSKFDPPPDGR
jgi:hypothetical protein